MNKEEQEVSNNIGIAYEKLGTMESINNMVTVFMMLAIIVHGYCVICIMYII